MTQDEKRIKLAEAAGWKGIVASHMIGYAPWRLMPYEKCVQKTPIDDLAGIPLDPLPDYFNDLNAVHELEKMLTDEQWLEYREELRTIVIGKIRLVSQWCKADLHTTAAQRCEALGQTLNLW
jgi:hypothetical protein